MTLSPVHMLLAGALAWFLTRPKSANAATLPSTPPAQSRPRPAAPARPAAKPVAKPTAQVAPPPAAIPWPAASTPEVRKQQATELAILNKPATQSTKRNATPAFNVKREDGSAPQTQGAALVVRERNPFDKSYWMPAKKVTPAEQQKAKSFLDLGMWQKGGVWYDGNRTFAERRQYRAVMHGQKKAIEMWVPKPPFV